jgi:hypothetical protein
MSNNDDDANATMMMMLMMMMMMMMIIIIPSVRWEKKAHRRKKASLGRKMLVTRHANLRFTNPGPRKIHIYYIHNILKTYNCDYFQKTTR